ncbi:MULTISPECIES: hypothetical protein [Pontibacillus]|uniref:DUF5668 domain-containing protein n=1 Tax=Pontibacillus chungwhensis TaxID=265426 RepID=A0ABY8V160_9BACI|nr:MULTISPECIES: hypothetical protein [Pontibacillus]MCD5324336.1 hypothetical protein [Pontibacillus sp. HN14]WIF99365.1 hypothetical protein QNI29_06825 [Pontibacillus chungwhensis]
MARSNQGNWFEKFVHVFMGVIGVLFVSAALDGSIKLSIYEIIGYVVAAILYIWAGRTFGGREETGKSFAYYGAYLLPVVITIVTYYTDQAIGGTVLEIEEPWSAVTALIMGVLLVLYFGRWIGVAYSVIILSIAFGFELFVDAFDFADDDWNVYMYVLALVLIFFLIGKTNDGNQSADA